MRTSSMLGRGADGSELKKPRKGEKIGAKIQLLFFTLHIYLEGSDLVTLSPRDETCLRVLYASVVSEITNGQNPN